MKTKKKLEDFENVKKRGQKLDQIKGGGPGTSSGAKIPSGDDDD